MNLQLAHIAILVDDYDKAIDYYTTKLGFELTADDKLTATKRWVLVTPRGNGGCSLLLAKADGDLQKKFIGNQSGGRVFLFLHTDDFDRDFARLQGNDVKIIRGPVEEPYGKVAVFEDGYGNKWDLIQPTNRN